MKIPGVHQLWRAAQRLRRRSKSKGLILMYHQVTEIGSDPWSLCVTPQHFAEHLEVLQKYGHPMQLQQLAQALRDENLPDRVVVVTFDDGYANNLHNAKPLLERYNIPATVFLTTGHIGCEREFWWDELDRLLLQPGTLSETLSLKINGNSNEWKLGEAASYGRDEYNRNSKQRAWEGKEGSRHFLYHSLWKLLLPLQEEERQNILDEIVVWGGAEPLARPTHRSLSLEETFVLAQGKLIEIASHTVTHPFLSAHPAAFQRDEIQRSKAHLEDVLGRPVTSFSYPHGNCTTETIALVREAGFACACSNIEDTVWLGNNPFKLPRVQVEDWDGEEFAKRLSRWFHG